jgi:hypothetical protein
MTRRGSAFGTIQRGDHAALLIGTGAIGARLNACDLDLRRWLGAATSPARGQAETRERVAVDEVAR